MKTAQWLTTRVPGAPTYTLRTTLMGGKKGRGKRLGSCSYWPDSERSAEAHGDTQARIEERARALGYTIIADYPY